jgi:hypothetical protein
MPHLRTSALSARCHQPAVVRGQRARRCEPSLHLFRSRSGRPGARPLLTSPRSAVRSNGIEKRQAGPSQAAPSTCPPQIAGTFPEHWERFAQLISHRVPLLRSRTAFDLVLPRGAAEKVIVTLDDQSEPGLDVIAARCCP